LLIGGSVYRDANGDGSLDNWACVPGPGGSRKIRGQYQH
jgi:hypothetical protein